MTSCASNGLLHRIDRLVHETTCASGVSGFIDDVLGSRGDVRKRIDKWIAKTSRSLKGKTTLQESAQASLDSSMASCQEASRFAYMGAQVTIDGKSVSVINWMPLKEHDQLFLRGVDPHGHVHDFVFRNH